MRPQGAHGVDSRIAGLTVAQLHKSWKRNLGGLRQVVHIGKWHGQKPASQVVPIWDLGSHDHDHISKAVLTQPHAVVSARNIPGMRNEQPALCVRICRLFGLPADSSIDALHRRMSDIARGNLQRIREGVGPRHATLERIAEVLQVPMAGLLSDGAHEAWPFQFVGQARWRACTAAEKGYIEAAVNRAIEECEAKRESRKRQANGG